LKQEEKTNIWKLLFILFPAILFGKITEILVDKNIVFTFIFTIIGVLLGFLIHFLTKKKNLIIKIISLIIIIGIPISILAWNLESELEKEWSRQNINKIEFCSPNKLKLVRSEIPENIKDYFNKFEIYNDGKKDKSIILFATELKDEDIDLKDYFEQYLESFKLKIPDLKTIEITKQNESETDIHAKFNFITKKDSLKGYSRFIKENRNLNMFWLIPFTKSYSKKYIEKFDKNISKIKL
jgi:hypothetical protein